MGLTSPRRPRPAKPRRAVGTAACFQTVWPSPLRQGGQCCGTCVPQVRLTALSHLHVAGTLWPRPENCRTLATEHLGSSIASAMTDLNLRRMAVTRRAEAASQRGVDEWHTSSRGAPGSKGPFASPLLAPREPEWLPARPSALRGWTGHGRRRWATAPPWGRALAPRHRHGAAKAPQPRPPNSAPPRPRDPAPRRPQARRSAPQGVPLPRQCR